MKTLEISVLSHINIIVLVILIFSGQLLADEAGKFSVVQASLSGKYNNLTSNKLLIIFKKNKFDTKGILGINIQDDTLSVLRDDSKIAPFVKEVASTRLIFFIAEHRLVRLPSSDVRLIRYNSIVDAE